MRCCVRVQQNNCGGVSVRVRAVLGGSRACVSVGSKMPRHNVSLGTVRSAEDTEGIGRQIETEKNTQPANPWDRYTSVGKQIPRFVCCEREKIKQIIRPLP